MTPRSLFNIILKILGILTDAHENPKIEYSMVSGARIAIGVLLIAEQKLLVNLIERQRKK